MPHVVTREIRRQLERDNAKLSVVLQQVPADQWPPSPLGFTKFPRAIWRSRHFLVQCFDEAVGVIRLSVARSELDMSSGRWKDGITWEELQEIKRQVGFGQNQAVEIFPADRDIVNVANMRHLWVLRDPLQIGWFK